MAASSGQTEVPGEGRGKKRRWVAFGIAAIAVVVVAVVVILATGDDGEGSTGVPAADAAIVRDAPGGDIHITKAEIEHWILQHSRVFDGKAAKLPPQGSKLYAARQESALEELLSAVVIRGQAEEEGIVVSPERLKQGIVQYEKSYSSPQAYKAALRATYHTQKEAVAEVEVRILGAELAEYAKDQVPDVTPAEVKAWYEREKERRYSLPASRNYRQIVNEDKGKVEAANKALEADSSPQSWKKVALKYSTESSRYYGGLRRLVTEETVGGPLRAAIFETPIGELAGPVKYEGDYTLIEPIQDNPSRSTPLRALRGYITRDLNHLRQERAYTEYFDTTMKKWVSRTTCAVEYLYDQCVNYEAPAE